MQEATQFVINRSCARHVTLTHNDLQASSPIRYCRYAACGLHANAHSDSAPSARQDGDEHKSIAVQICD